MCEFDKLNKTFAFDHVLSITHKKTYFGFFLGEAVAPAAPRYIRRPCRCQQKLNKLIKYEYSFIIIIFSEIRTVQKHSQCKYLP